MRVLLSGFRGCGASGGEPVHGENVVVQSDEKLRVRQHVRRQCPCLSGRALEQPQTAGPCCSLRELPAPPRRLRFPAHARGVPALPPRLDKGTGGRAAGHKEALS